MAINEPLKDAVNRALEKGWSVRGIAKSAGLTQPTISLWLSGKRGISTETAEALCEFFEMRLTKAKIPKAGG